MKQLALANGDLVVGPTGHKTITGAARIRQDLALALGEEYGSDRFHRGWGSVVTRYVGQPVSPELELLVQSEVNRVIQNYIAVQRDQVLRDNLVQRRSRFDTSDVVRGVDEITVATDIDTIKIKVRLTTQDNESVTLARTVTL